MMGDVIAFRPKIKEETQIRALPRDIEVKLQTVMSHFPFESVAAMYSNQTASNLKMTAFRGLLFAYEKFLLGATSPTIECDNFNCSFEFLASGPEFYLDYVVASAYSAKRTRST